MGTQTISVLVEGGKATAGPPLGPQLGPLGVNTKAVVDEINKKTKEFAGMKIPVTVTIDTSTKEYSVEVGTPPAAALIKKELSLEKGSQEPGKLRAGDLSPKQVKKIAIMKFGSDAEPFYNQIVGTARSMGISVGEGAVTEEEQKAYEEQKKAEEAEAAAKAAPAEAEKAEEAEAAEGEAPEKEEEGKEKSKEEKGKEEKPKE